MLEFKYLGTTLTNQNSIAEEIKSRLISGITLLSFGAESFAFQVAIQKFKINIYRTIILPVVLYGYENRSLKLRDERKVRVSENMVLRRIFGRKSDEVMGEWRRLHNEELNDMYTSPNIFRVIKSR